MVSDKEQAPTARRMHSMQNQSERQPNVQLYKYSVQDGQETLIHEGERSPNVYKGHLVRAGSKLDSSDLLRVQRLLESTISTQVRYVRFQMGYHIFQEVDGDA